MKIRIENRNVASHARNIEVLVAHLLKKINAL